MKKVWETSRSNVSICSKLFKSWSMRYQNIRKNIPYFWSLKCHVGRRNLCGQVSSGIASMSLWLLGTCSVYKTDFHNPFSCLQVLTFFSTPLLQNSLSCKWVIYMSCYSPTYILVLRITSFKFQLSYHQIKKTKIFLFWYITE